MSNTAYFQALNKSLRDSGRIIPYLVVDLDRLDQNIGTVQKQLVAVPGLRLVAKSLPSIPLLEYLMEALSTRRLMVFHQPFLQELITAFDDPLDILFGKPMPTATVAHFYQHTSTRQHRIQWLVDTVERLEEYLQLAQQLGKKLQVNLEIDVGLHRGGFRTESALCEALTLFQRHPEHLEWAGFMGYDPQVVKLPRLLGTPEHHLQKANDRYRQWIDLAREEFPALWRDDLTLNGAGSPTFGLHQQQSSPLNEVAIGSAFLKPTSFDIPSLEGLQPAAWIAAPVLKKFAGTRLPGIGRLPSWLSWLWPYLRRSYFIYGGYWKADYCYPPDIRSNQLFGPSTNQSMLNTSGKYPLEVDDFVFLRPWQSEFVLLQFGRIITYRKGEQIKEWSILKG